MRKLLLWSVGLVAVIAAAIFVAAQVSPWPSVLVYRFVFSRGGVAMNDALAKHVPAGVTARLDERYDPTEPDATFDAYHPTAADQAGNALPTIVWVHGGGFFAGTKDEIANYLRIVAARGYAVIGVNYSLSPRSTYPTPIRQVNAALGFVAKNAKQLRADPTRLFLAGDSAGSQIAAQVALVISDPRYAAEIGIAPSIDRRHLRGVILHCGVYDTHSLVSDNNFVRTVGWSYFGTKDFSSDPRAAQFSIVRNITANFPPMFISAGNADPLGPQSRLLAEAASKQGVNVDSLFYPEDYKPPLAHEYQFNLDIEAGRLALERSMAFLKRRSE